MGRGEFHLVSIRWEWKFSSPFNLFWPSVRGKVPCYCRAGLEVLTLHWAFMIPGGLGRAEILYYCLPLASTDTDTDTVEGWGIPEGELASLQVGGSRIPDSLLGFLWHQPIGKGTSLVIGVGKVQILHPTHGFCWYHNWKGACYQLVGMKSPAYDLTFSEIRVMAVGVTPSYSHMRWKSRLPS